MEFPDNRYDNMYRKQNTRREQFPFMYSIAKTLEPDANLESPRWHEHIEIKYMLQGRAEIICGPNIFIAEAGDVVVINSCQLHGIRQYGDTTPVYHLLMVPPELIQPASSDNSNPSVLDDRTVFKNLIRGNDALSNVIMQLFEELDKQMPMYVAAATGYLSVLSVLLLRERLETPNVILPERKRYIEKIRPAIEFIHKNYSREIRLETLAATCSLSHYHFARVFKQVTGETPVNYLNQFRIYKAAALLANSRLPISDVAYMVGFVDEGYFSKCFRTHFGISPKQYRESSLPK